MKNIQNYQEFLNEGKRSKRCDIISVVRKLPNGKKEDLGTWYVTPDVADKVSYETEINKVRDLTYIHIAQNQPGTLTTFEEIMDIINKK